MLGLDRAPEVKTIRRKLGELAAAGRAGELQLALARHHAAASPDTLGFLYIDGHTRAYFGKWDIQKMHVTRLKFPGPATEETWVTGSAGDPLLVVMAQPSSSLAAQIRDLLPALRDITGPAAKPVLCFDRGGWSPALLADITDARFDLLTYRKNDTGKDIPDLPEDAFSAAGWTGGDGREHPYELADTMTEVTISEGKHKGRVLELRQVTRRKPGDTRQVHILTTRPAAALPAAGVIYRMTSRWREENYFRYGRAHFALDALDTYATTPEDPARMAEPGEENRGRRRQDREENPHRRRDRPRGQARRAAPPRPRHRHRDHQPGPGQARGPSTPPAATCKPPRPPPGPSRRRSR